MRDDAGHRPGERAVFRWKRTAPSPKGSIPVALIGALPHGCFLKNIGNQSAVERSLATEETAFTQTIVARELAKNVRTGRRAHQREHGVIRNVTAVLYLTHGDLLCHPAIACDQCPRKPNKWQERFPCTGLAQFFGTRPELALIVREVSEKRQEQPVFRIGVRFGKAAGTGSLRNRLRIRLRIQLLLTLADDDLCPAFHGEH